jgi:HEPN domain-containing protein
MNVSLEASWGGGRLQRASLQRQKGDRMASQRDKELNHFAIATFRDTADRDYIVARMAFRAQLYPQFVVASHQAIEKYLKCMLFFYRVPATHIGHQVGEALKLADAQLPFKIDLHPGVRGIIKLLDETGPQRYFELPWYIEGYTLARVDHTVWELRRYCQPIDHDALAPDGTDPEVMRSIASANAKRPNAFKIASGVLESVIVEKRHPARAALLWQNLMFSSRHRKVIKVDRGKFAAGNPPLSNLPQIIDDVVKLAKVPAPIVKACKDVWLPEKLRLDAENEDAIRRMRAEWEVENSGSWEDEVARIHDTMFAKPPSN